METKKDNAKEAKKPLEEEKDLPVPEDGPAPSESVQADAAKLKSAPDPLEAAQKELLYMRAEFENTKKRLIREQEQAIRMANEKILAELVNPLDLLDRAIAAAKPLKAKGLDSEVTNFITGVEMTQREFIQLLQRFGVEFIGNPGEKFDPVRHEAISQQETSEDKKDTVLEVLQKGCVLQGRLVKPARVVVGR